MTCRGNEDSEKIFPSSLSLNYSSIVFRYTFPITSCFEL